MIILIILIIRPPELSRPPRRVRDPDVNSWLKFTSAQMPIVVSSSLLADAVMGESATLGWMRRARTSTYRASVSHSTRRQPSLSADLKRSRRRKVENKETAVNKHRETCLRHCANGSRDFQGVVL